MTRWRPPKAILLVLALGASAPAANAQDMPQVSAEELLRDRPATSPAGRSSATPSDADWVRYYKDGDYGYKNAVERYKPQPVQQKQQRGWFSRLLQFLTELLGGVVGVVLLSALVLLVVGYLIYKIVGPGGFTRSRGVAPAQKETPGEDEDLRSDWERRMQKAEAEGDLRLAVRCGYMRYLQLLQESGEIRYRQDKTNTEYFREISDATLRDAFRSMSRLYEFSWYGLYRPSDAAYAQFSQTLSTTKSRLQVA